MPGERVVGLRAGHGDIDAGAVVISGGAWSPAFERQLGVRVPVVPARGQIIHVRLDDADTGAWPIVQPILGHYVVPWPGGRIAVGATVEPEAGFRAEPTVAGMRQLFGETMRVVPGLSGAVFLEVRVGLRPVTVDGLPVLGRVPGHDEVFVATGYGADGLLLSPYSGELVAHQVLGTSYPDEQTLLAPFGLDRVA
jgi:D-amino-acid dehydrogenase